MHRIAILVLLVAVVGRLAFAQTAIVRVSADQKNRVHIAYSDGRTLTLAGEVGQVGIDSVRISKDGQIAGWLALYPDPDSSSPFAGTLVLWQTGKVIRRFEADQTFWSWSFYANGAEVAYHVGPTHGAAPHCELHDIESGRLLASWEGDLDDANRPPWTKGLDH